MKKPVKPPSSRASEEHASARSAVRGGGSGAGSGELDRFTLERARRGDQDAAVRLVKMYERRVFSVISRMLVSRQRQAWVPDLAQETFLRVFRSLDRFESKGKAKLSTWILTIATRLSIDELRRRRPMLSDDMSREPSQASTSALRVVELKELGEAIVEAVEALSEDHRAVFILREYHDMPYDEIAAVVQCDVGTVKSRLARARANLRAALEYVNT